MMSPTAGPWRDRFGFAAECWAAHYLEDAGLTIVERRYRCRAGEIDLIARDDRVLVFVEVKARRNTFFGGAAEAVGWRKQRRIAAAARDYLRRRPRAAEGFRFDVIAVVSEDGCLRAEWIRDAFRV